MADQMRDQMRDQIEADQQCTETSFLSRLTGENVLADICEAKFDDPILLRDDSAFIKAERGRAMFTLTIDA